MWLYCWGPQVRFLFADTAAVWWLTQSGPEPCPREAPVCVVLRRRRGQGEMGNPISRTAAALAQDWHTALGLAQNPCKTSSLTLASSMGFEVFRTQDSHSKTECSFTLYQKPFHSPSLLWLPQQPWEVFPAPQRSSKPPLACQMLKPQLQRASHLHL